MDFQISLSSSKKRKRNLIVNKITFNYQADGEISIYSRFLFKSGVLKFSLYNLQIFLLNLFQMIFINGICLILTFIGL